MRARELTPQAFEALLAQLDPDRERAAAAYETLRTRLIRLFEWRACGDAAALADETLTRVARRLAEGVQIRAEDPFRYLAGVAHFVLKEQFREAERERTAAGSFASPVPERNTGAPIGCLERCLEALPEEESRLLLGYYQGDGRERISSRAALAERLGIDLNALRVRVHRLRQQLEACVERCFQAENR